MGKSTRLVQTAIFSPRGLSGALYGHALSLAHGVIFSRLAKALAALTERSPEEASQDHWASESRAG